LVNHFAALWLGADEDGLEKPHLLAILEQTFADSSAHGAFPGRWLKGGQI
jgi:hypothetical protein